MDHGSPCCGYVTFSQLSYILTTVNWAGIYFPIKKSRAQVSLSIESACHRCFISGGRQFSLSINFSNLYDIIYHIVTTYSFFLPGLGKLKKT